MGKQDASSSGRQAPSNPMDAFLGRFRPGRGEVCACGRPHEIQTRVVIVRRGAVADIP